MNPFISHLQQSPSQMDTTPILTPDQRLRVFVSSTLQELAEERLAVKEAIQKIHLTPVMFEMGARPHAPRNLYRQYLAQSQIFVGVYWDRYGWVAPEETVSGLEDEYNLSGNMPKLIYIKQTQGQREDRLTQLLHRIQQDDKVSYKTFTTAEELGDLIINDLAVLLTERFNLTLQNKVNREGPSIVNSIPAIPNTLIGREKDIEKLRQILEDTSTRLITLTGPGGIGKTRLATEIARRMQDAYPDGAVFVPLAPVKDARLVTETICYAIGIKVSGDTILESLKLFLQEKKFLLVLDNFEQVLDAASIVEDLLAAAPKLKIIVTSRARLSLSFEHLYVVPTLSDMDASTANSTIGEIPPAIELFIQRAKAIQPSFQLTAQNRETIYKICHRLEGLPLAIELAAGQISLFSPTLLLQKLDHRLDVLKGNFRDIPDRQKTIRKTIEWSYDLLSQEEQCMLLQMSLYHGGCLLEALEKICPDGKIDVYAVLGALIDKSLVTKQEEDAHVRFQMFESVREFAIEKLKEKGEYDTYKQRLADYYHQSLDGMKLQKNKINQTESLKFLEREHANIRQALEFLMEKEDLEKVTDIAWNLWLFWWVNAHTREGYTWLMKAWEMYKKNPKAINERTFSILMANIGFMAFLQRDLASFSETLGQHLELILQQEDDELVATATLITGVVKTIVKSYEEADQLLLISLDRFRKIGLTTGISLVLSALGRNAIYNGTQTARAKEYYRESMELAKKDQNEISVIITLSGFALCEVMEKNSDAKNYLREAILLSQSLHFYEAIAWAMEIWALVSINEGNYIHAITLMGAVDHLRHLTQLPVWEDLQEIMLNAKKQIEQQMDAAVFQAAWAEGTTMNLDRMVAYAMEEIPAVVETAA